MAMFIFYRLHRTTEGGASAGYQFFTNEAIAKREAATFRQENPEETAKLERIEADATKLGILSALNVYASHADNG